jgi:DNA-binding GntR family transcriptional regulator
MLLLERERLVVRVLNRGVSVTALTAGDIDDLFAMRRVLELEALRCVAESGKPPTGLELAVARLEELSDEASWRDVLEADLAFHRSLVDSAGSQRLRRANSELITEITLCLIQQGPYYSGAGEVAREHRALLTALGRGHADRCEVLLLQHLEDARECLRGSIKDAGEESA